MKSSCYSLFVILAGVLWGIISVFLKGLYSMGFTALQVMFFRGFISSIFMGIFLLIKDRSLLKFELKDIWMFLGTGVISLTFFFFVLFLYDFRKWCVRCCDFTLYFTDFCFDNVCFAF